MVEAQLPHWAASLVTRTVATTKIPGFSNAEYAFRECFCDGNSLAASREYQHLCPYWRLPYRRVLERVHRNLKETGTFMMHALAGRGRLNI
jgi:hypothetical protein